MRPWNYCGQYGHWMWECLNIYKLEVKKNAKLKKKQPQSANMV